MHTVYPPLRQIGKRGEVRRTREPFRLETSHLARRGRSFVNRSVADDPPHCRITAQPFGVVHVLIAGEPSEHRLAQQSDERMPTILAGACIGKHITGHVGQADRIVQLPNASSPASEVITEPRDRSLRRRSKSSLNAAPDDLPAGSAVVASLYPE